VKTEAYWTCVELDPCESPSNILLEDVFRGYVPAIVIPDVIPESACADIVTRLDSLRAASYDGIDLAWALPEEQRAPGHWEIKFHKRAWLNNVRGRETIDTAISELFGDLGHPRNIIERSLANWAHGPVGSLIHPLLGEPVLAGQLRRGAPQAHVDDLNLDSTIARTHGQLGINLILSNPDRGDLEVFNVLWNRPGFMNESGMSPIGNYGIPASEFEHAPMARVSCGVGSIVIVANRFVHRVSPVPEPLKRLTFALHGVWMLDGSLRLFS
jgi:hypothetical protein